MSIHSVLARSIAEIQRLGMEDQLIQQLGREGFFVGSLSQLEGPTDVLRLAHEDRRMIEGIASALTHGGPGIPEDIASRDHYVMTERPVRLAGGAYFAKARFRLFDPETPTFNGMTIIRGETPRFVPPPRLRLDTGAHLDILQILEYAGIHYTDPRSPAAGQGFATFLAARSYVRERLEKMEGTGRAPDLSDDWVGFDWDFTADVYRIYAEILPLISMKLFHEPPRNADQKYIRVLEAAKPGIHEMIVGMMAGYAGHQGLLTLDEWENYRPQVRIVTQTWPQRLMVLGNDYMRLLPLLMGRLPGIRFGLSEVTSSRAFITLHDFLDEVDRLLDAFREAGFRFENLEGEEQDDLIAIFRTGKGHVIKPISAFQAKGWARPSTTFDDGPVTNAHLRRAGVQAVQVLNPLAPGKEMSDLKVITLRGRRAAFRQMLGMLSRSEATEMIDRLTDLLNGEAAVDLKPGALTPTPEGTVVPIHDTHRSLSLFFPEFEERKRRTKLKVRQTRRAGGGMGAIERAYREAVAARPLLPGASTESP